MNFTPQICNQKTFDSVDVTKIEKRDIHQESPSPGSRFDQQLFFRWRAIDADNHQLSEPGAAIYVYGKLVVSVHAPMSALPPKADIRRAIAKRLLLTRSGRSLDYAIKPGGTETRGFPYAFI